MAYTSQYLNCDKLSDDCPAGHSLAGIHAEDIVTGIQVFVPVQDDSRTEDWKELNEFVLDDVMTSIANDTLDVFAETFPVWAGALRSN